ncbi:transglutaminase domain-containing protein [Ureaplasma diversum]|uniref:transglutaminase domain-containing protein n=1 Tax=Ureaplasma diversum TaxID=42094 RepID=UPI000A80846F|nr:transglutaminase domain-containing protein [Ureaplasma diversum]
MKKKLSNFLISTTIIGSLSLLVACTTNNKTKELIIFDPKNDQKTTNPTTQKTDQKTNNQTSKNQETPKQENNQESINNDTKTNTQPEPNQPTQPSKNQPPKIAPKLAYEQLVSEVNNFINNDLKELKYEFYRDQLNDLLNNTSYSLITKQYKDWDSFYTTANKELLDVFNSTKANYKNAIDPNLTSKDLVLKQGTKEDETVGAKFFNDTQANIPINEEAKAFVSLLSLSDIKDYYFSEQDKAKKQEIQKHTKEVIKGAKTTKEKIRKIYDWIHSNLKYAFNNDTTAAIDPVHALKIRTAVCGGFSNLYKAMLDSIDVKNVVVIGWSKFGAHQWNLVYDEETKQFFHSDPTWGKDPYFSPSIKDFSKDHRATKILNAYYQENDFLYEYDRGFTIHKYLKPNDNKEVKPPLSIKNKYSVVAISQSALSTINHLYVHKNIKRIDYSSGTYQLKSFNVDQDNIVFSSLDGVLYSKDKTTLLVVPTQYTKDSITLSKNVKTILDWKSSLDSLKLKSINVEAGNYWYGSFANILYDNSFSKIIYVPRQINHKVVVHSNTKLEANDFAFNNNIKEIILSEGIKTIPDYFINNLTNLELVHLPASLEKISKNAFTQANANKLAFKVNGKTNSKIIDFLKQNKYKIIN